MIYPAELIEKTVEAIGLQGGFSFVEKDLFVTDVIKAMGKVKNDDFELIFMGGTCLSKAHKIVQRMSEDIDFVLSPRFDGTLNSSATKKKISEFRRQLLESVKKETGLAPRDDQIIKGNGNQFTRILIDYPNIYDQHQLLRKAIKIELTTKRMHLPTEQHAVNSLVDEAMETTSATKENTLTCVSLTETASDKWTALCKRMGESETKKHTDPSLIRHLYDLTCIQRDVGISEQFEKLVPHVLLRDRQQRKGKNPELYANPVKEMNRSVEILQKNKVWETHYNNFVKNMVFQKNPPTFKEAMDSFLELHDRAIHAIEKSTLFQEAIHGKKPESTSKLNHTKKQSIQTAWTEDQEKKYSTIVQKYIRLKKEQKQNLTPEETENNLMNHASKMTELPTLMRYVSEKYRGILPDLNGLTKKAQEKSMALTPEKIHQFNTIIKKYETLQEAQEKNTENLSKPREALERHAFKMSELPRLMRYVEKNKAHLIKNIQKQALAYEKNQSYDHDL